MPSIHFRGVLLGLVTASTLLLGGCAAFDNAKRPEAFKLPEAGSGMATIVISTGAPQKCMAHATDLRIFKADKTYGLYGSTDSLSIDNYSVKSDFSDHHGYLSIVKLPAGPYYFAPYLLQPFATATRVPKAEFTVQAGDVAYFGEYFLTAHCGLSSRGEFRDQAARDLPLLEARNPALAKAVNRKFIPAYTGLAWPVESDKK
jgi:hypothetical protein